MNKESFQSSLYKNQEALIYEMMVSEDLAIAYKNIAHADLQIALNELMNKLAVLYAEKKGLPAATWKITYFPSLAGKIDLMKSMFKKNGVIATYWFSAQNRSDISTVEPFMQIVFFGDGSIRSFQTYWHQSEEEGDITGWRYSVVDHSSTRSAVNFFRDMADKNHLPEINMVPYKSIIA